MALTRLAAFPTGSVLTSSQLTTEFDNIYNNALTLISPLTGSLSFGGFNANNIALGSAAAPSINWTGNTNTGFFSAAANQVGIAVAGVGAANFTAAAAGPHVIGSATTNSRYALYLTGTITLSGATQEAGFTSDQALTNASGVNLYGSYHTQTLTNVAGATTTMAWLTINPSALTITAGSVTNAAGLYITGNPSAATNNVGFWNVGASRLDGTVFGGTTLTLASLTGNAMLFGRVASVVPGALTEDMRLSGGTLLLGTTVTTSTAAGDMALAYAADLRGVVSAGTDTQSVLSLRTVGATINVAIIGRTATDIGWGKPLVALGAGAAATLGNIGGSGPATAGQNTWMRVIDSGGAAFWVPAWK